MLRSFARAALGAVVVMAVASACGSDDSKKNRRADEDAAGMGGESPSKPSAGGSKNFAGEPGVAAGGAGAGAIEPNGGHAPVVTPEGGAAGQPGSEPTSGAAGVNAADGGAAGAPAVLCCQPVTCAEAFPTGGWGYYDDGCGRSEAFCDCPPGTLSQPDSTCAACEPDPEYCTSHCGDTVDNCGNPITCADNCSDVEATCYDGSCCNPTTSCDEQCGEIDDGCGGTLDCGVNCDGGLCVGNFCCHRDNEACLGHDCGQVWDNCEWVDCGEACTGSTACIDDSCKNSVCLANGFACGSVNNPLANEGVEDCGSCPSYETCVDNVCIPICGESPPQARRSP